MWHLNGSVSAGSGLDLLDRHDAVQALDGTLDLRRDRVVLSGLDLDLAGQARPHHAEGNGAARRLGLRAHAQARERQSFARSAYMRERYGLDTHYVSSPVNVRRRHESLLHHPLLLDDVRRHAALCRRTAGAWEEAPQRKGLP